MTVTPYNSTDSKKAQVKEMFNNIASKYDFLNRFLSLGVDQSWRRKAIASMKVDNTSKVIDVATGTADLAIAIEKKYHPAKIIGLDLSDQMLVYGRKKIAKQQLEDKIELVEGDSENLPFESNTFDAASVAYGVRNFEDLDQGLREINRTLKTGGQLMVLEFSKPGFPIKQLFDIYFKYLLPLIGKITSKDQRAYSYLYESVQSFPDGEDFVDRLEAAGFKNCECKRLTFGISSIYLGTK